MTSLTWQTLLLLAVTYFAGCCLGCWARRSAWKRREQPVATAAREVPLTGGTAALQSASATERAIAPAHPVQSRSALAAPSVAREAFRRAEASAPIQGAPTGVAGAGDGAARFQRALEAGGTTARQPTAATSAGSDDDLKRIKAIDAALEARLKEFGVRSYEAIARWTADDTARVNRELGFKGRIERENWIEQAQILARGDLTSYARRLGRGEAAVAHPTEDEGEPRKLPLLSPSSAAARQPLAQVSESTPVEIDGASPDVAGRAAFARIPTQAAEETQSLAQPPRPAAPRQIDDLKRIRGITAEAEVLLNGQGVTRYAQISGWTATETERFDELLGESGRIARENWIEQAHILARGGDTAFSRDFDERAAAGKVQMEPQAAVAGPASADDGDSSPDAAPRVAELANLRSVRSPMYRGQDGVEGPRSREPSEPDDLKRIRGIGLLIEKRLNSLGVTSYEHIANWTAADIDRVSQVLDFKGRIERENWVEQARILGSGGQTEFSRRIDRSTAGERVAASDRPPDMNAD